MDELLRSGQLFLTEAMSEAGDRAADERRMLGIANAYHLAAIANALAGKSAAEADAAALERLAVEAVDQASELAEELRRTRAKLAKARRKRDLLGDRALEIAKHLVAATERAEAAEHAAIAAEAKIAQIVAELRSYEEPANQAAAIKQVLGL